MIAFKAVKTICGKERVSEIFMVDGAGMLRRGFGDLAPKRVPREEIGNVLDSLRSAGNKLMYLDATVASAFFIP